MKARSTTDRRSRPDLVVTAIVVTTALFFGRQVFIPIATAFLLSFLASPLVERLERRGLGRLPAVLCSIGLGSAATVGLSFLLARQVYDIAYR
ncbi:MAG TPA: hypothetical protein VH107_12960, partial [Lacipirellulaceae bacterium]|nr:hypothetical protein [Lacipirellulaceae bacterium]